MKIPILMFGINTSEIVKIISSAQDNDPFDSANSTFSYFGPNARWLLAVVLGSLNLKREDGIAIITTSDETYISTCVSVTSFNYAGISRTITENTKVAIIIHEFGYVFPDIIDKVQELKNKGIVVIEDCAHIVGYEILGRKIGCLGDYSLFSLPKIIPAQYGGLLRTTVKLKLPFLTAEQMEMKNIGVRAAEHYLSKYKFFNESRQERASIIRENIVATHLSAFEPTKFSIPYFLGIITDKKKVIQQRITNVEWGATLRNDLLYLPTNPFVPRNEFRRLVKEILVI